MKIAIIAGHGGSDPGAVDPKEKDQDDEIYEDVLYSEESDIVLKASKILRPILENNGHEVIMVRKNDKYMSLKEKATVANNNEVGIAISIHANAAANTQAEGIETLYYPTSEKGKSLADNIQKKLIRASKARDRGIKPRDNLYILKHTAMPTVLLELGFLTNNREEHLLNQKEYLYLLVQAVAEGIEDYKGAL